VRVFTEIGDFFYARGRGQYFRKYVNSIFARGTTYYGKAETMIIRSTKNGSDGAV
jgi:hypothetical protein